MTALMEREAVAPVVKAEELELVKRTVANGATPDELKLYLYDCARQGVHPLDKLIHFTKRSGKYTPITSIDFMRIRAADTGEYAGSDDAEFNGVGCEQCNRVDVPTAARVTVWRLVQGQRCAFTATARWSEYKPEQNDFMWRKMPHTMLAKCAEALALRKGFPRQLAGLYAKEEMDQADKGGYVVEAPVVSSSTAVTPAMPRAALANTTELGTSVPNVPDSGQLYIARLEVIPTSNKNIRKVAVILSDGRQVTTIKEQLAALAEQLCQERIPVTVETKTTKWGEDLVSLHRALPEIDIHDDLNQHSAPVADSDIPF